MSEKRAAARVSYPCEVECFGAGATPVSPRIADISATGAFIDTMTPPAAGTPLQLKFRLGADEFVVKAEVTHDMPQIGMGVRFVDLSEEQKAQLTAFVSQRA